MLFDLTFRTRNALHVIPVTQLWKPPADIHISKVYYSYIHIENRNIISKVYYSHIHIE